MGNCTVCNLVINGNRRGKKYCSNACKQQSYYVRRKGGVLPTFDSFTNSGFSFEQFLKIKVALGKDNDVSFLEYSFPSNAIFVGKEIFSFSIILVGLRRRTSFLLLNFFFSFFTIFNLDHAVKQLKCLMIIA